MAKTVPINSNIEVFLADGYTQVNKIKFIPDSVIIVGPQAELNNINKVHTIKDTLLDLSYSMKRNIDLVFPSRLINSPISNIEYHLDIRQISERIIVDIPIQVTNKVEGIRVFPSPQTVSLTVVGGVIQISNIKPSEISVTVDFKLWNINQSFYEPRVSFPFEILDWKDLSPRTIELGVARESK